MVTVYATLQETDGKIAESSSRTYELSEAQVTALLNSDIVTYPQDGGNGYRTSVKTRIVERHFSLFESKPTWNLTFQILV